MAAPTKMEFAVQMTCEGCVSAVKKSLHGKSGIELVDINLDKEQVIVKSSLPSTEVKDIIETTGKRAVLVGHASSKGHLGAAVSIMEAGSSVIKGVVRFVQSNPTTCVVEGTLDGLPPGTHTACVHEFGDISRGCTSCGEVIGKGLTDKVSGIIAELKVGEDGRATFQCDASLQVGNIIGRSMVIHQGHAAGIHENSYRTRLVCGIIARSAGLFENTKKICTCDGVTIWEEREKPVAGPQRQKKLS